MEIIIIKIYY